MVFALYLSKAAILKRALRNKAIVVKIKIQPKFKYKSRSFLKCRKNDIEKIEKIKERKQRIGN